MAFSASEAAFEGFRLVRREPKSILAWAILQLVFSLAVTLPLLSARMSVDLPATGQAAGPPSAAALAGLGRMMGLSLILLPLELVFFAVLSAAVYRAVLRPQDKGLGRLKFGADELRLIGLYLLFGAMALGVMIVSALVLGLLNASAMAASRSGTAGVMLVIVGLDIAFMAALLWVGVRLSLAGPMTFASGKIQVFTSWGLTRGRFWSLFGCYLLALVFILLIEIVFMVLEAAVAIGGSGGSLATAAASLFRPNVSSLQAYFTPVRLVLLPIGAALGAIFWAIGAAPPARAYKDITGLSPEDQAEAFS